VFETAAIIFSVVGKQWSLRIEGKSGSSGKTRIGVRGITIVFAARGRDFIASSLENKERNGDGTRIVYAFVAAFNLPMSSSSAS
jgi:hypothetical protein